MSKENTNNSQDLELKPIEKLANGEISSEAYSLAILKLKEKGKSKSRQIFPLGIEEILRSEILIGVPERYKDYVLGVGRNI